MYTAITNNYDNLKEITIVSPEIDYIAFTDNKNLKSKIWKIVQIDDIVMDHVRTVKHIKMLPHLFLKEYQYSIWIDGSMRIKRDIQPLLKHLYKDQLTVFKHPQRNCIYQEMEVCCNLKLDDTEKMKRQMETYRNIGYPKNNGLIASGVLLRQHHNPEVIQLMEDWWKEIVTHSKRDQLSFNYAAWTNRFNYKTLNWVDLVYYFDIFPHAGKR
jgi:hypothetical protein